MANEVIYADQWLYSVLSTDATLASLVGTRIYSYLAPDNHTFPFALYSYQGSHDVVVIGAYRVFNSGLYQVKGVDQSNSFATAGAIANRIDTLLQRASGSVTNGIIYGCSREQPIQYPESSNGLRYAHSGGLYRIYCQGV